MALPNWDETSANGRRRVFRIEIDRPLVGDTVARFHLERVFDDANGHTQAQVSAGSWSLPMTQAMQDPELAPIVGPVAQGLEVLSQILYEREVAAALAGPEPDPLPPA